MRKTIIALGAVALAALAAPAFGQEAPSLWQAYEDIFKSAKYID